MRGTRVYELVATAASTPYITGTTGSLQLTVIFQLCEATSLIAPQLLFSAITYVAAHEQVVQSIMPFQDTVAKNLNIAELCGPRKLTVTPANTFLTLTAPQNAFTDPWSVSMFSKALSAAGTYSMMVTASLIDYPYVPSASVKFDVVIVNPCTLTSLLLTQVADMTFKMGDPALV